MPVYEKDEIWGYWLDQLWLHEDFQLRTGAPRELVCVNCAEEEKLDELTEDMLILKDEVERSDDLYFCDRCKKQLPTHLKPLWPKDEKEP